MFGSMPATKKFVLAPGTTGRTSVFRQDGWPPATLNWTETDPAATQITLVPLGERRFRTESTAAGIEDADLVEFEANDVGRGVGAIGGGGVAVEIDGVVFH